MTRYTRLDYLKSLEMLLPLAQGGDPVAQEILGFMYAKGEGIPADEAAAYYWFTLAADRRTHRSAIPARTHLPGWRRRAEGQQDRAVLVRQSCTVWLA